ncbi:MAG: hypothetical protein U9Q89_01560 [Thermodesulfobacteriota bacterium]|nr:hypothetical protein [Thermodesulfobacteriota bacterium]
MITSYIFTEHARFEIKRRALSEAIVVKVIENPEQQWEVRNGRSVMQSRISMYGTEKQLGSVDTLSPKTKRSFGQQHL